MLIPNFKAYTELVRDQTRKYISKIQNETDEKGLRIYEKLGTQFEFDKLVDLDKRIQEKYIELDNAIQSTPEINNLANDLKKLLNEADVVSTVVAPSLYKSKVKIGKDNVENDYRLDVWTSKAEGLCSEWCLQGARDGVLFYRENKNDKTQLKNAFSWVWLREYFTGLYKNADDPDLNDLQQRQQLWQHQ